MSTPAVMARLARIRADAGRPLASAPVAMHSDDHAGGPETGAHPEMSPSGRRARSRGEYRSFFTFDSSAVSLDRILEQTSAWLRDKGFDEPLDESGFHQGPERALTVVHRRSSHCHDVRILLAEPGTNRGRWDTELTMHIPERAAGWLSVHVTNDAGCTAAPPRLARWLLDVLEGHDGTLALTSTASTVRTPDDVEELLEAVCDPDRHGLVFVAGTAESDSETGRSLAQTQQSATNWARNVVGLGQVVVLDPLATAAFNAGIGVTHGVDPWTVRTYAPLPDPAWAADARRHRIFSAARLRSTADAEVGRILGLSARAHAADRPLPASVAAADRDLNRALDRLVLDRIFGETSDVVAGADALEASRTLTPPLLPTATGTSTTSAAVVATPEATTFADAETAFVEDETETSETSAVAEQVTDDLAEMAVGQEDLLAPPATDAAEVMDLRARVEELESMLNLVGHTLGLDEVNESTVTASRARQDAQSAAAATREAHAAEMAELARERLEQRSKAFEELEDDLRFQNDYADYADELRDESDLRARRAADEAQFFRRRLAEAGQYDTAYGVIPSDAYSTHPDSFVDLMARMKDELEPAGVVFTGDASVTGRLDAQDTNGRLVRSTWECLVALAGYVEAKRDEKCTKGVHGYLTDAPAGYSVVSKNKFAPKESTSTMNKFGDERRFAVPGKVCAEGAVLMEAHFKLGALGIISPRLHFHDDSAGTGNVYVGYIGPHLRTEATN